MPTPMPAMEPCLDVAAPTSSILRKGGGVAFLPARESGLCERFRSRAARTSLFSSSSDASKLMGTKLRVREGGLPDMMADFYLGTL